MYTYFSLLPISVLLQRLTNLHRALKYNECVLTYSLQGVTPVPSTAWVVTAPEVKKLQLVPKILSLHRPIRYVLSIITTHRIQLFVFDIL